MEPEDIVGNFKDKCKLFCFPDDITSAAIKLFHEFSKNFGFQDDHYLWLLCAFYAVYLERVTVLAVAEMNDTSTSENNLALLMWQKSNYHENYRCSDMLSLLLNDKKICLTHFFDKFYSWLRVTNTSDDLKCTAYSIEEKCSRTVSFFCKFKKIFTMFFNAPQEYSFVELKPNKRKTRLRCCTSNELFHYIWFFFIFVKEFRDQYVSLEVGYNLLVCCLRYVLLSIMKNEPLAEKLIINIVWEKFANCRSINPELDDPFDSLFYKIIKPELEMIDCSNVEFELLQPAVIFLKKSAAMFTMDRKYLCFKPEDLATNLRSLLDLHKKHRCLFSGIDETDYPKTCYTTVVQYALALPQDNDKQNYPTPITPMFESPIRVADGIHYCPGTPQKDLKMMIYKFINEDYFQDGLSELYSKVHCSDLYCVPMEQVAEVRNRLVNNENKFDLDNEIIEESFKLYYTYLYKLIEHENERSGGASLNKLLSSSIFHKSLLAVCFIANVFMNNHLVDYTMLCKLTGVHPFFLVQCISSVIQIEPKFPPIVIRHLTSIEEHILRHEGWNCDSPLFSFLDDIKTTQLFSKGNLPYFECLKIGGIFDFSSSLENNEEEFCLTREGVFGSRKRAKDSYCSIVYKHRNYSTDMTNLSSPVVIFYQKVYYILLQRLNIMVVRMHLTKKEKSLAWKIAEFLLVEHPYCMIDHFIDHIIVAAIYYAENFFNISISIDSIVQSYIHQVPSTESIFQHMTVSHSLAIVMNSHICVAFSSGLDGNLTACLHSRESFFNEKRFNDETNLSYFWTMNRENDVIQTNSEKKVRMDDILSIEGRTKLLKQNFTLAQLNMMEKVPVDMTSFYNEFIAHLLEAIIYDLQMGVDKRRITVPPYPTFKVTPFTSPIKISKKYAIFVSPMKSEVKDETTVRDARRFEYTLGTSPRVCREMNEYIKEDVKNKHSNVKRRLIID